MTEEEKQEIIDRAVEKTLLMIPEVIGNLLTHHAALAEMNQKFYAQHGEFANYRDVVASVVEMVEGRQPTLAYKDILEKAVPIVRERLKTMQSLDMTTVKRPDRR